MTIRMTGQTLRTYFTVGADLGMIGLKIMCHIASKEIETLKMRD